MSDESALLVAIWENPHDDTVRLAYADWLQETGAPANVARAEFIRLQCALAGLVDYFDPARLELEARCRALRQKHGGAWKSGLPPRLRSVRYQRGFPLPSRTLSLSGLGAMPVSEWNAVPNWNIALAQHTAPLLNALAANPCLLRVGSMALNPGRKGKRLDLAGAEAVLCSPHARNLASLDFTNTALSRTLLDTLFTSPTLPSLNDLSLFGCGLSGNVIRLLAESARAGQLSSLDVQGNYFEWEELQPLFTNAARFTRLKSLGLATPRSPIPKGALTACVPFPALRSLYTDTAQVFALAEWLGLATLEVLSIYGGAGLGLAEAQALVASPLGSLVRLSCSFAPSTRSEAVTLLKDRFGAAIHA